ncbi:MAG: NUDIX hydrolase [Actinobacteria bacterium]|nr:NUDIX hydrolase [Actinomycetota bacterium]
MREWTVAGGLVEDGGRLLLVCNRPRWGGFQWTPPGGVIDDEDDGVESGLSREVLEETGIRVSGWTGPVYEVSTKALDMGWHMRVQVFIATAFEGDLVVDDPDGIVVEALFVEPERCAELLADSYAWVREPLGEWLGERWGPADSRLYEYEIRGTDLGTLHVERIG